MTISQVNINFDQSVYYPGQMITGRVVITVENPKNIKGVELKIKGRAKFKWTEEERYKNSEGQYRTRTITHRGKELYLRTDMKLVTGSYVLSVGVHEYRFAVKLPANLPTAFSGKYGGIAYYGKAKVILPMLEFNKTVRNFFHVVNVLDLNLFPQLKTAVKLEESKTFCCLCCASGPLTMVVFIPKTGYAKTESIPITVEIDNASNVNIDCVNVSLSRIIQWKARSHSKCEKDPIKTLRFGEVSQHSSKTWSEIMPLDCGPFPNIRNCNIISMKYLLEVEADPSGAHTDLEIVIPLTIGDILFCDSGSVGTDMCVKPPVTPGFPQQVNSDVPGSFTLIDGSTLEEPNLKPNVTAPYPSGGMVPESFPSPPPAYSPGTYPSAQSQYTQPGAQYPSSPYAYGANVGGTQPTANTFTSAGFSDNFVPSAPSLVDHSGGNSVAHSISGPVGSINSGFYNPNNANPSHNFNY